MTGQDVTEYLKVIIVARKRLIEKALKPFETDESYFGGKVDAYNEILTELVRVGDHIIPTTKEEAQARAESAAGDHTSPS